MTGKAATRRAKARAQGESDRLDATPERLARAAEAGQRSERGADKLRRLVDPFDVMRSTRALAPHDPRLNDLRWLIGEALAPPAPPRRPRRVARGAARSSRRRGSARAALRPAGERDRAARARQAARRGGARRPRRLADPDARRHRGRVGLRDCRRLVPEIVTPWRADAVLADRLRVGLDRLGEVVGRDGGGKVSAARGRESRSAFPFTRSSARGP